MHILTGCPLLKPDSSFENAKTKINCFNHLYKQTACRHRPGLFLGNAQKLHWRGVKTKGSLVHKADNTINPIIALALSVVNLLAPLREAPLQEIP